ncbi:hypothetical protein WDR88_003361 [Enterobacter cloacae]|uniref:hypothetical protein n=1 Tax=Enterobacter cloacae complex TaxID=354276 RepID=UPI000F67EEB1|nr:MULTISPECIES: hypothetical protein [Enterobacter cloacae complex]ELF1032820.1 hypothetical protein [Enterobacter kobei]EMC9754398.1 hypothetical protein [Enterobacter cloacae]HCM9328126.1 hypothetical protein [Enterobacter hormaechei subsp. steigerwaltii]
MSSHSFNLSSLRSKNSPMAKPTSPEEHAIAHEVLLIAIMKELKNISGDPMTLINVHKTCSQILDAAGRPNSKAIAADLITEAQQSE